MQIIADVGGIPGKDCRGYCKYCYFRKVKETTALGCKNCSPGKIGCETCTVSVSETKNEFMPPFFVLGNVQNSLMMGNFQDNDLKINISGGGDVSCYPHLLELTSQINQLGIPIHMGYTSGKGIDDAKIASDLISHGVEEITFTVFSTDAILRKKWMSDPTPQESLKALQIFAENIEVHAASVIIPGVNDGDKLYETCTQLENWGAKALILMRFANYENQGLILGNEPIIKGIEPHTISEFGDLVKEINKEFDLRITGTPLYDPENNAPFALSLNKNKEYLTILPQITSEATILTSKIAAPFIKKIIKNLDAEDLVNVYAVEKDIGCLITYKDLEKADLSQLKETVLIPGRAFVHDKQATELLTSDGVDRIVARGPNKLSVDGEMSNTLTEYDVIEKEMEAFYELIEAINFFGVRKTSE
ncbi:methyl coenzyme M reductase-arginine methyltransferase Mmp10 [Methanobacterium alcaliphilum]|uniref:methyl coenzyme M reductase-arginine methyltransferase Mmp10 n=1 Tax=Methanobacterium alcaliphilum TaxID=392018 RepID=UPI00200AEB6D|nr:methyl coenzyme M reductase-arginine methyltransferase Mmp10 [Methanobacterium alcaliphilum]MCK9151533.1 methyl coenzyme M reductase-arginine methyltransferase Mmp10 [Methanobacterium alcaliphilum]